METITIYFGGNKPAKARGKNQCNLLRFAFDNPGIHSYKEGCRATKNAILALAKKEIIVHHEQTSQFEWNTQYGK